MERHGFEMQVGARWQNKTLEALLDYISGKAAAGRVNIAFLPEQPTDEILGAIMGRDWKYCGNGMRDEAVQRYAQLRKALARVSTAQPGQRSAPSERTECKHGVPYRYPCDVCDAPAAAKGGA